MWLPSMLGVQEDEFRMRLNYVCETCLLRGALQFQCHSGLQIHLRSQPKKLFSRPQNAV